MIVTSRDGTRIAYDRQGGGPALILVGGSLDDGAAAVARVHRAAHRRRGRHRAVHAATGSRT
jgi:hypothetical protein